MLDVLTVDQSKSDAESTSLPWSTVSSHTEEEEEGAGYFRSQDESANQQRLHDIFPQFYFKDIIKLMMSFPTFHLILSTQLISLFIYLPAASASTALIISFSSKPEHFLFSVIGNKSWKWEKAIF